LTEKSEPEELTHAQISPELLGAAAGIALGLAITLPYLVNIEACAQEPAAKAKELDRFITALERIHAGYGDQLDQSQLIDAAIKGMVGVLDAQSSYISWPLFRDMQISFRHLVGLGVEFIAEKGHFKVIAPIDGSPAAKAGLKTNDIITQVDGVSVEGFTPDQLVLDKLIGPVDSRVRLTLLHEGQDKPVERMLVREMTFKTVRSRQVGGDIGYLRIPLMNEWTMPALEKAISELSSQIPADKLKGYVLDLRNTPHGGRFAAVSIADAFLEEGEIVSVKGANPEQINHFNASPGDIINGKPLVVLINRGTAAGAEIVAGALQDHKRATVMGTRSFGKGSEQTIIWLGERSGAIRLTTGRYFTPAGRAFDGKGILPDIEVPEVPAGQDNDKALALAFELLRGITAPHEKG
jgi:carboxyl-terminal processing protease